jgi:3-deoxy-7-phosphoheptulonate synthase
VQTGFRKSKFKKNLNSRLLHDNSCKQSQLQPLVAKDITQQIVEGNLSIMGIMPKSHLFEGNQSIPENLDKLKYGVSVTDACINWEDTEILLKIW